MSQNRQERLLESLLALPGNSTCADCKAPAPRWASTNLGTFLCVQCASIHRSLGTHTSRVKSLTMDMWTREMVDGMREWGNIRANAVWNPDEKRNPPPVSTAEFGERQGEMERYIRDKYEAGLFRADRKEAGPRDGKDVEARGKERGMDRGRADSSWNALGIPDLARADGRRESEDRAMTYGYNGHGSGGGGGSMVSSSSTAGGKKKATRAHVDSNWADLMAAEDGGRPSSGGDGRKAGRLLGMEREDGRVRLPPVTKAPAGLVYKREGNGASEVPRKRTPEPQSHTEKNLPAAPLVDLGATAPMQRTFPQPPPMPSPLPTPVYSTNPFLQPIPSHLQPTPHMALHNPSIHNGGYLSASTTPLYAPTLTSPFPFMGQQQQQQMQMQGYFPSPGLAPGPGPTSAGGYFGGQQEGVFFAGQEQQQQGFGGQGMQSPFGQGQAFGQGMGQGGFGYGGWSR